MIESGPATAPPGDGDTEHPGDARGGENVTEPRDGCSAEGLLLVDKPAGLTSHDVVDSIRRLLGGVRCGHAGTLDPFATGLLLVAVGRPTRLLRFLSASDKSYEGLIRLGFTTDTDDRTGNPTGEVRPVDLIPGALDRALTALSGSFDQVPPDYSARKHQGVPHYRLARRGQIVPKQPVTVSVAWRECSVLATDLLRVRLDVSAGTYIRALARDLGAQLGCGGHLAELRRVRSGPFEVGDAIRLPSTPAALIDALIPPHAIPLGFPTVVLPEESACRFRTGATVLLPAPGAHPGTAEGGPTEEDAPPHRGSGVGAAGPSASSLQWIRLIDLDGRLVGVGEIGPATETPEAIRLQPRIVF